IRVCTSGWGPPPRSIASLSGGRPARSRRSSMSRRIRSWRSKKNQGIRNSEFLISFSLRWCDRLLSSSSVSLVGRALEFLRPYEQRRGLLSLSETRVRARELHVEASVLVAGDLRLDQRNGCCEIAVSQVR